MFHRTTRKTAVGGETPPSTYRPPRHWLPDPVSRTGATFYAFAGAALWEGADLAVHYAETVVVPALNEASTVAGHWVTALLS